MAEGNKPEERFQAGAVTATVWKNTQKGKDNEDFEFFTVNIERNYKDKDDKWQKTSQYRLNDLPKVALVQAKAYEYLAMKKSEESE